MRELPAALAPMGAYRQFLCYRLIPSATKAGKFDKIPVSPHTGEAVNAHDPRHWVTAAEACAVATLWGPSYGVAFSLQKSDPFFFLDLDDHFDPATGQWSQLAQYLCSHFNGAALEVSQSGRGLHIIGIGTVPPHGNKNAEMRLEFYTELRFIALTGTNAIGNAATDCTAPLSYIVPQLFPPKGTGAGGDFTLSTEPVPEWRGPTDDDDLIRRAMNSRSAASVFGNRASFADLWTANIEALSRAYPDPNRPYDASSADAALIAHLAFWTGRHGERIERLMRRSALAREKWNRDDYLPRSIASVLAGPGDVLTDAEPEPPSMPAAVAGAPQPAEVTGNTFLSVVEQRALFSGCVYVTDRHRALVPGGALLKAEQFRVAYGGYTFAMDAVNERTTRNAWEAFTESQALRAPRADSVCFRPDLAPGEIVDSAGRALVNTYWPANVERRVGDPSPFLQHLAKLLPNERDRGLLLSYMAAIVQYKGVKFQWAPVVQGAEGNGKTALAACVAHAIGQHYTHWPDAKDLSNQFNGWLSDKLFIAVEELYRPEHRNDVVEDLKTIITGSHGKQIQFKGVDQTSMQIVCNLMLFTNHRTAVRKTPDNGRRFGMFYTAQQSYEDLQRHGMDEAYFGRLFGWLRNDGGWAIVSELLHTYPIPPEYNPVNMARAPHTSTTDQAAEESLGAIEQHIAEAIAQDTPGFMGGWVSSIQLDRLISDTLKMGHKVPLTRRREMLRAMGYILHPGLPQGRTHNAVTPDNRRPQLYVRADSPAARLTNPAEIARTYSAAQNINPQTQRT